MAAPPLTPDELHAVALERRAGAVEQRIAALNDALRRNALSGVRLGYDGCEDRLTGEAATVLQLALYAFRRAGYRVTYEWCTESGGELHQYSIALL